METAYFIGCNEYIDYHELSKATKGTEDTESQVFIIIELTTLILMFPANMRIIRIVSI